MRILAYLDPGSGSVLLQALLGGIAAAAVAGKLWWGRILTILRIRKPETDSEPDREGSPDEPAQRRAS